jgi:hypothetical protein
MPSYVPAAALEDEDEIRLIKIDDFLKGKLTDEDRAEFIAMMRKQIEDQRQAQDLPAPFPGRPTPGGAEVPWRKRTGAEYRDNLSNMTGNAMDSRTTLAADAASRRVIRGVNEYHAAQAAVAPVAGHVVGKDAADVYRQGLRALGVNTSGIVPEGYRGAFDAVVQNGLHHRDRPRVTTAAGAASFDALFPGAAPVRHV